MNEPQHHYLMSDATALPAPGLAPSDGAREEAPAEATAEEAALPARPAWRGWAETLMATLLILLLVEAFLAQGFKVDGDCMLPNLASGERLLGNKLIYRLQPLRRGDIVVFRPPHRPNMSFIKRVVGLPGEVIAIHGSSVYINGVRLREPYLQREWGDDRPAERIPPGMLFVMGDNRENSNDSRTWGELPIRNVEAKAWLSYWPPSQLRVLK